MTNGNESGPDTREEKGLMKQIEEAKSKGDMGRFNFLNSELAKRNKEHNIALEYCQKALETDPNNPKYLVQMGLILNKLRRFRDAIEYFDKVLNAHEKDIKALRGKGMALNRLGENERAMEYFDKVLELDSTDVQAWEWKGSALSFLGRHEEALECYEKALDIKPNQYTALRSKAFALFRIGKMGEAVDTFDELLKRDPNDLNTVQGKATAHFYGKDYEEAIESFKNALDLLEERKVKNRIQEEKYREKAVNFLRKIGASLSALEKDEKALHWFDKALDIDSEDYNTLRDKGVSLSRLGREEEALDYFKKALQKNRENFPSWREMGAVLSNLGREKEAINCYWKAIEINPDDYHSYRQLGISFAKLDPPRSREANAVLRLALEINPDDIESLREIGFNLFVLSYYNDAIDYCKKLLEIVPNDPLAHLVLARILEKKDVLQRSLYHYEKFRENATSQQRRKYFDRVDLRIERLEQRIQEEKERPRPDVLVRIAEEFEIRPEIEGRHDKTIFDKMKEKEDEFKEFTTSQKSIKEIEFPSFLAVLRRWNSYTPLLPLRGGLNKGGGYFLYHNGKGIVIDPGFNFLKNFYQEGFNFADIDAVMVTHAHIDHTIDLEPILTIIDRINKNIREEARKEAENEGTNKEEVKEIYEEKIEKMTKKIDLFLNKGTLQKYKELICCTRMTCIEGIYELEAGKSLPLSEEYGGIKLFPMKAKHDEILDSEHCLGYVIEVDGKRIGLTGDTGWDPDGSIGDQYKELSPDLMITHIGSIKKKELGYIYETTQEGKNSCFYPTHLGLLGVTKILDVVRPELAIISEFGEELKDQRVYISQKVGEVTKVKCLPGDIGLYIRISDLTVFCEASRQFVHYEDIIYENIAEKFPGQTKNPKICYYKKEIPFEEVKGLQFEEEARREPLPVRIRGE